MQVAHISSSYFVFGLGLMFLALASQEFLGLGFGLALGLTLSGPGLVIYGLVNKPANLCLIITNLNHLPHKNRQLCVESLMV